MQVIDRLLLTAGQSTTEVLFTTDSLADIVASEYNGGASSLLLVADEVLAGQLAMGARNDDSVGGQEEIALIPSGETSKHWKIVAQILDLAMERGLDRHSLIVSIGGGVVSDVTTFAASIYLRGIAAHIIPTTLLSMVDAAFGGKTGINWKGFKNIIGSFYPAKRLIITDKVLQALPQRHFTSGISEAIKSALLGDVDLFGLLRLRRDKVMARDSSTLFEIIRRSLRIKARIVADDYLESGRRALLNLGHTFAHALEAIMASTNDWTHGEAVAWGIVQSMRLGVRLEITDRAYAKTVIATLKQYGFRIAIPDLDVEDLLEAMAKDKKRHNAMLRFVLQRQLGDTIVESVPSDVVAQSLYAGLEAEE